MKFQPLKRTPVILALTVLLFVCAVRFFSVYVPARWDAIDRIEKLTYDFRSRVALNFSAPTATNLAFVAMTDSSIDYVNKEYNYSTFPWPRFVYGHLVNELSAQGAKAVAFDVLFGQLNKFDPAVQIGTNYVESDNFFAEEANRAGNVIIASTPDIVPPDLFATNTLAIGDVTTEKDIDGTMRRVKAFDRYRRWDPLLVKAANDPDIQLDLSRAQVKPGKIIIPQGPTNLIELPVDAQTNYAVSEILGDPLPAGIPAKAKAFTDEPRWQMGIVLAARELRLDLNHADIDLPHGRITLQGPDGLERVIPVDKDGYFYVDWRVPQNSPKLLQVKIEGLLEQNKHRLMGDTNAFQDPFRDKLVMIGSSAQGNNLTDRGATPLDNDTLLVSTYWNVANSVITDRFIHRASLTTELIISFLLGLLVAFLTWQLRTRIIYASISVAVLILVYIVVAVFAYVQYRLWLPLFFPVAAGMLVEHGTLIVYLVMVEEREKRRVKAVFSKIVSPDVVDELLEAEDFNMVGSRREVTVLFADVRGFTSMTDEMQEAAVEYARVNKLDPVAAEKCFDDSARETLETVNMYLTKVADAVIASGGTLDKYIGDCVMAFWGAPVTNEKHALGCVQAALAAQRAIRDLNEARMAENVSREAENPARIAAGLRPNAPLRALQLGTGINTGTVIVGLMGSGEHISNYTIFGREVNLASRLEGVSGSGRIIIGETTHAHLMKFDPALAATCLELPAVTPKGFRTPIRIFEVPWKQTNTEFLTPPTKT